MQRLLTAPLSLCLVGCASLYATPVRVNPAGPSQLTCVEKVLSQARLTGYVEQTVDKEMGFFRVIAMGGERGKPHPHIAWFNVQCLPGGVVQVSAVGKAGALNGGDKLNKLERAELVRFAGSLGQILGGAEVQ